MKQIILIVSLLLHCFLSHGQFYTDWKKTDLQIIPFKSNGLWGLKNIKTDSIVLIPTYKKVVSSYYDSTFIVRNSEMAYGAIDNHGEILIRVHDDWIFFNEADTANSFGKIMTVPKQINNKVNWREYFINSNHVCIPTKYFLCPYGVEIEKNGTFYKYIDLQKAEEKLYNHDIDSAISLFKLSIEHHKADPFVYYWISKSLLYNKQYDIDSKTDIIEEYSDFIESSLLTADKLEQNIHYKLRINKLLSLYYKVIKDDITSTDKFQNEVDDLKEKIKHEIRAIYWWDNY